MTLSLLPDRRRASDPATADSFCSVADLALLGLHPADGGPTSRSPITWVVETELVDPSPVVVPGALVLTRGTGLTDPETQAAHVLHLKNAGAACLAFATCVGGSPVVPAATLRAAREARLTVVTVPADVSFAQVSAFVAHRLAPRVVSAETESERQCALLESAASGAGVQAALTALSHSLHQPLRLVTPDGVVLAQYPPAAAGRDEEGLPDGHLRDHAGRHAVVVDGVTHAYLVTPGRPASASMLRFGLALLGMELARSVTEAISRRRALGQVLEDIVGRVLSVGEAHRRLGRLGVDADRAHSVVMAALSDDAQGLLDGRAPSVSSSLAVLAGIDGADRSAIAAGVVENSLCFLLSDDDEELFAERLHTTLLRHCRKVNIGIGAPLAGPEGLRTSFLEAREGTTRGVGINRRKALTLTGLLRAQESVSLTELAKETLQPLVESDRRSQADLVATLRVLLDEDFSVVRAAEALYVHRNTVKYRIAQIERLTGLDLSRTADRAQIWVAVSALSSDA